MAKQVDHVNIFIRADRDQLGNINPKVKKIEVVMSDPDGTHAFERAPIVDHTILDDLVTGPGSNISNLTAMALAKSNERMVTDYASAHLTLHAHLADSYGDGWQGALMTLQDVVTGTTYTFGEGFVTGSTYIESMAAVPSGDYLLRVSGGQFPSEISYTIQSSIAGVDTVLFAGTGVFSGNVTIQPASLIVTGGGGESGSEVATLRDQVSINWNSIVGNHGAMDEMLVSSLEGNVEAQDLYAQHLVIYGSAEDLVNSAMASSDVEQLTLWVEQVTVFSGQSNQLFNSMSALVV